MTTMTRRTMRNWLQRINDLALDPSKQDYEVRGEIIKLLANSPLPKTVKDKKPPVAPVASYQTPPYGGQPIMPKGKAIRQGNQVVLNYFSAHATVDSEVFDQMTRMKRVGQWINAIKLLRQKTGLGLKDSKDLVENCV